jgi:hypothetical protein
MVRSARQSTSLPVALTLVERAESEKSLATAAKSHHSVRGYPRNKSTYNGVVTFSK